MTEKLSKIESLRKNFNTLIKLGFFAWGGIGDSKAPYGKGWQHFGEDHPTADKIDGLFNKTPKHIGIILPFRVTASGEKVRVTVFDCECEQVGDEVLGLIQELCPELEDKIAYRKNTNSGGIHVFVQHPIETLFQNIRLYDKGIELKKSGHENDKIAGKAPIVFELLGISDSAKYCIVFAEGREYISKTKLDDIQTLTPEEMRKLETVLERMKAVHPEGTKESKGLKGKTEYQGDHLLAYEKFNDNLDVPVMLENNGWKYDSEDEERWYYTRPGKEEGKSVSIRKDNQVLHVFTSSTDFEKDTSYNPFQVYALLNHGVNKDGNYKQVAKLLNEQLYKDAVPYDVQKETLDLPGNGVAINNCAENAFKTFGDKRELFYRGGTVQEIITGQGTDRLEVVKPERLCSIVERYFHLYKWHVAASGPIRKATCCTKQNAELLLATDAARDLPEITILSSCPILAADGRVLQRGYDGETKSYVLNDLEVKIPPMENAVKRIKNLLQDFKFYSDGDRSRALAALLTPALTLGGFLKRTPFMVLEADHSQTGKGYFVRAIATLYGEQAHLVVQRSGGVGSFDESLASRLATGNPFINIDNLRGHLNSPYLESLLTAEGPFSVRLPYKGEIMVDSRQFCIFGTSNAVEFTSDTANRMSIIRLHKQPSEYQFKKWKAGDLIEHIVAHRKHLLGAVFAVLQHWIDAGKPRTKEHRHDFRVWTQSLDWIVQNTFEAAPLMDGFSEARERITNCSLGFIRQLGILIEKTDKLNDALSASALYTLCEEHRLEIPKWHGDDAQAGCLHIGKIFGEAFKDINEIDVDEYIISRQNKDCRRGDGKGMREIKFYTFQKR